MKRLRLGWSLLGFVCAIFLMGWMPLPNALLGQFEFQYERPAGDLSHFVGVVVLGGNGRPMYAGLTTKGFEVFRVTERMIAAAQLARSNAQLKVLYTNGSLHSERADAGGKPAASQSDRFFLSSGVAPENLLHERAATNTRENAVLSAKLEGVVISQRWLLLTSASHMPRAMATFKNVGWNVTAYPVDYRTRATVSWLEFSLINGASLWQNFAYEFFAWAKYMGWVCRSIWP